MKMYIETREDALLHCFDLWLDLAVTGSKNKSSWIGWKYLQKCMAYCPVCDFSYSCQDCIVNWGAANCGGSGSPFRRWEESTTKKQRSEWALEIAILTLKALFEEK